MSVSVSQIVKTAFAVIIPAQYGCECKENEAEHQTEGSNSGRKRKTQLKCSGRYFNTFKTDVPGTSDDNGETCHGTDDQGINDGSQHGDQALFGRHIHMCRSGSNRSTSKSCFIGKDSTCNSLLHCQHHGAKSTT